MKNDSIHQSGPNMKRCIRQFQVFSHTQEINIIETGSIAINGVKLAPRGGRGGLELTIA